MEGSYYLSSENKGADQLRSADLRLCFCICKNGFLLTRLKSVPQKMNNLMTKPVFA